MTTFQKVCTIFIAVCVLILVGGFSYKIGHHFGYKDGYSAYHPSDTVWRTDTHYVDKPIEVVKWKDKKVPVYIAVHDTTKINDTTYVVLPREFKVYQDSTYTAQVSGVDPSLDWINVYQKTAYISVPVPEYKYPELIISPSVEAFVLPASFGAIGGVGVDYWSGRWQWSLTAGYGFYLNEKQPYHGWSGKIGVKYNLIRK